MKIVQTLVVKLLCLLVLFSGVLMIWMWFDAAKYLEIVDFVKTRIWVHWGFFIGLAAVLVGFFGFLPIAREKKSRNIISYPGTHGSITIQLESVESTLNRVLSKLPEVRKISVKVSPTEDNHRARVSADVQVYKGANTVSAREVTNRIGHYLHDAATNILGVDEVTDVNLNIRGILVDAAKPNILRETTSREAAVQERDQLLTDTEPVKTAAAVNMAYLDREQESMQEPDTADQGAAELRNSFASDYSEVSSDSSGRIIGSGDTSFSSLVEEDGEEDQPDSARYPKQ